MTQRLAILVLAGLLAVFLLPGVQLVYAQGEHDHIHVNIDVKPGSFPNAINMRSNGVVPVALLGSAEFDVHGVDTRTVTFGPMHHHEHGGGTAALRYAFEDVNGDGYMDLIFHFATRATGLTSSDTEACLHGEHEGHHFCGHDSVKVIG